MPRLPTVLLRHTRDQDVHYDWLMANPHDSRGLLWAARVAVDPADWLTAKRFDLQVIAPHRRRYLQYEGPLSENRGSVERIDEGDFIPLLWSEDRIIVELKMKRFAAIVTLMHVADDHWQVQCGESTPDNPIGTSGVGG